MILIGSRSLKIRAPHIIKRDPLDFDFICTLDECNEFIDKRKDSLKITKRYELDNGKKQIVEGETNLEFEIIQPGKSSDMFNELVNSDSTSIETPFGLIPNLDLLFTLKSSHKYLRNSPHFWKTMLDIKMMEKIGAKVRPEYKEFLKVREDETYWYKHPKLNQSKQDFFADDGIVYKYDHDTIHESVKTFDRPAYTYYMKDGSEVQWDKDKFFALPHEYRIAGVAEESYVLALERSIVPHFGVKTPKEAFIFALSKVCSSITSGKFREFAWNNAFEVINNYKKDYVDKFYKDVADGKVKKFNSEK